MLLPQRVRLCHGDLRSYIRIPLKVRVKYLPSHLLPAPHPFQMLQREKKRKTRLKASDLRGPSSLSIALRVGKRRVRDLPNVDALGGGPLSSTMHNILSQDLEVATDNRAH